MYVSTFHCSPLFYFTNIICVYRARTSRRERIAPRRAPPFQLESCGPAFGYPGHHHLGPSPPLRDVGRCQPRIVPLHLVGDVGRSLRPMHARPPPLFEGCVSVGGGGGRTQLGSCRGGVRETRRRETTMTQATIVSRTRWLAKDSERGPTTANPTRPGPS
jgi:hypothetical protein